MFEKLQQKSIKSLVPIIKPQTEKIIVQELNKFKPQNVVEIGSAVWYSSLVIANQVKQRNWVLTSFEISYAAYMEALENFSIYKQYNINLYNLDPLQVNLQKIFVQWKIDFLFIDATMRLYLDFFLKFQDLLENNCVILLDNVIKFKSKTLSLYEFLEKKQINYEIFETSIDDGIMKIIFDKKNTEITK